MEPAQLLELDDIPTARICGECKGEGMQREETATQVRMRRCKWCNGTGKVLASGQMAIQK